MNAASADVVVVGAGIVGCSIAYHLSRAGAGSVVLLDRADAPGRGSTGACAGGFRHQFTTEVNIRLSQASTPMILGFTEQHGIEVDVRQDGYLFLERRPEAWTTATRVASFQRSLGVPVELLDAAEVRGLLPGLAVDDLVGATFCAEDGIADPGALTQGYATLAARAGVDARFGVEATAIEADDDRVRGLRTDAGPIGCGEVVLATGAWTARLAATAGVDVPIRPIPRTIVTTAAFPGVPDRRTLVIDTPTSFYFHREADGVLMGMAGEDVEGFDTTVDERWVADALLPRAVAVFPPVAEAGVRASWAGLYEMTPDRHPIVGEAIPGLWIAAGFSGHGFQHGPVVGKLLAELLIDGAATTVDVDRLRPDRFATGEPMTEGLVV
jgi:glycine/D-amino acid oxidase-like deaminating enzyme